jgi:cytidylate kinase
MSSITIYQERAVMAVITISRQLGSGGDYIANMVASMMGYNLVNKQSLVLEAQRRGVIDASVNGEIDEKKPPLLERFIKSKSQAVYAIRSILREAVIEGNSVVVGRGGNMELKDRGDLFNVRIIAPLETRINRIKQENNVDRVQAINTLKQSDRERAEYVKHFFLVDSSNPELYDIIINTGRIPPDSAARLITQAIRYVTPGVSRSSNS